MHFNLESKGYSPNIIAFSAPSSKIKIQINSNYCLFDEKPRHLKDRRSDFKRYLYLEILSNPLNQQLNNLIEYVKINRKIEKENDENSWQKEIASEELLHLINEQNSEFYKKILSPSKPQGFDLVIMKKLIERFQNDKQSTWNYFINNTDQQKSNKNLEENTKESISRNAEDLKEIKYIELTPTLTLSEMKVQYKRILVDFGDFRVLEVLEQDISSEVEIYNEIILLQGRLKRIDKDDRKGIISEEMLYLERNKISDGIIRTIDGIKKEDFKTVTKKG